MKKIIRVTTVLSIFALAVVAAAWAEEKEPFKRFNVYTDKGVGGNHFVPSGWMGDYGGMSMNDGWTENAHSGRTCIKVTFKQKGRAKNKWVGLRWQEPENNWGDMKGGFDLTGARKLVFWIRGEKGNEVIDSVVAGGIEGKNPDSFSVKKGPISLGKEWQKVEIDLGGQDLSHVIGGFGFSASDDSNPRGLTFYLDDIYYE
jgi:hypothetical protein